MADSSGIKGVLSSYGNMLVRWETDTRSDPFRRGLEKVARFVYQPYKWLVVGLLSVVSTTVLTGISLGFLAVGWQRAAHAMPVIWARLIGYATPIFPSVKGREHIEPGQSYVVVANHLSMFDIILLYGWLGIDFRWVMKMEIRRVPILGYICEKLGHIYIDRSRRTAAISAINRARGQIRNGRSVVFFPEGTRSRDGHLKSFKKGAFVFAQDMNLPILPVSIRGTDRVMPPDGLQLMPGRVFLEIHPPILPPVADRASVDRLMHSARTRIASGLDS